VWRAAYDEQEWEAAKRHLWAEDLVSLGAGNLFRDCALVVIAEHLLRGYMNRLERWRVQAEPLHEHDSIEAENCQRNYMPILKGFYPARLDVNLPWYSTNTLYRFRNGIPPWRGMSTKLNTGKLKLWIRSDASIYKRMESTRS
jgi:hypothetical protein